MGGPLLRLTDPGSRAARFVDTGHGLLHHADSPWIAALLVPWPIENRMASQIKTSLGMAVRTRPARKEVDPRGKRWPPPLGRCP